MKVACLLIAGLMGVALLAQLACETQPPTTTVPDTPPTPTRTRAQLLTGIPPTATAVPSTSGSSAVVMRTQVIPPMETLNRFSVDCLESRLETLESGEMFTPLLKALVECLTPLELAATRRYVPPGGGPAEELPFACNDAWFDSIRAMYAYFDADLPVVPDPSAAVETPVSFNEQAERAGVVFRHNRDGAAINLGGGGDGEGLGKSEGGASVSEAEAAVRVRQGALPRAG